MKSGKLPSVVTPQQQFARIESPQIQRSTFDRSHGYKTTLDAGKLYPVFIDEALPGDTFSVKATMFGRLATPLKPIMDNINFDIHFFSVPYRLVWDNWHKFNGEQENPDDSTNFLIPTLTSPEGGYEEESIYDYLGIPTKVSNLEHSALPLRAINLIWNEWYRDQNLQDSLPVPKDDGPDSYTDYTIPHRNKRKDYFTSALPSPQKGEAVSIPLGDKALVWGNPHTSTSTEPFHTWPQAWMANHAQFDTADSAGYLTNSSGTSVQINDIFINSSIDALAYPQKGNTLAAGDELQTGLYADLSEATAATINALRQAFQVQKMFERDARGGTRYTELIKAHFGVTSPDARLQRPEYLGGGSTDVQITPIAQTSNTADGTTPQGNLSGVGTFTANQNGFVKSFTEHEIVVGFVSIRADLNYQQGLHKMWSRKTRFDFYWPSFANLGEQAILNKEIFAQGSDFEPDPEWDDKVFGYQERYAEYRFKPSLITGKYRSNADQSLDLWHLAQDLESSPALNSDFIKENPPIERVVAVPTEPQFLLDCYFNFKATRPMPTYSTPGLIDHF